MTEVKELQRMTLEEFLSEPQQEGWNYELIDGIRMMSPRPSIKHQRVNGKLYMALWNSSGTRNCEPIQEADLIIEGQNFIPDLMLICDDDIEDKAHYDKPPIIVIEIVSPTSGSRDYFVKRREYRKIGVQEYWIVSPEEKCVMVICFTSGEECRYCEGKVKSYVLPEIEIDLASIFE